MFPDSKITRSFKCSRTKTTAILNEPMRSSLKYTLVECMKEQPFAFANDGTSDCGIKKMNAFSAYILDVKNSKSVEIKFYEMCAASGEHCPKAVTLFNKTDETLSKDGVDWCNVISCGLDNTNSRMGCKNSLKSRILEKNSSSFVADCNCHLVDLAAGKGGQAYETNSSFSCEDHQCDIYYFCKGSSRMKGILTEYLEFVELDWGNFLRYVKTCWRND